MLNTLLICELGLKNQHLISRSLALGLLQNVSALKQLDEQLTILFNKSQNSIHLSEEEQRAIGITYYIWRTRSDGKVRPSHAANNNHVFAWDNPPATGHPGTEYGCRCWAEPIRETDRLPNDPPIEPIYPELLIISLLPIGRLRNAWQLWVHSRRDVEWNLGKFKSAQRWANQLKDHDWSPEQIEETLKYGKKFRAPNKINPGNKATRYEYNGRFIVRDEKTKDILQISDRNFKPNEP